MCLVANPIIILRCTSHHAHIISTRAIVLVVIVLAANPKLMCDRNTSSLAIYSHVNLKSTLYQDTR